jgi:serine/threonine protein kinase
MPSVDDLLADWVTGVDDGCEPTPEELCIDCPELLGPLRQKIKAFQLFSSRFGLPGSSENADSPEDAPDTPRLPLRSVQIQTGYQIEKLHAVGGLGSVYLAFDPDLNRRVAVKIPRGWRQTAAARARFEREARITSRLDHPGVVPVLTIHNSKDGLPWFAMRFIEGQSLQQAIDLFHQTPIQNRYGSSEFRNLLHRFQVVCDIVAYAHRQGVLHRDIKPGNILLGEFGETLLVDWGLAKVLDQPDDVVDSQAGTEENPPKISELETELGKVIGTPAYASPEQLLGQSDRIGVRSDVFSLGATLYCLLTGEHLLQRADLPEHLQRIQNNQLPHPRTLQAAIPAPLDAICRKALAIDPLQRYVTPQDLSQDIERFLADEPISIPGESWWARSNRWVRRHTVVAGSTMAAILVGLVASMVYTSLLHDKNQQLAKMLGDQLTAFGESQNYGESERRMRVDYERALETKSQVLKALQLLSDEAASTYPRRDEVNTSLTQPLREALLKRHLEYAAFPGNNSENLYIRALGHLHAGGLILSLGNTSESEVHLLAARRNLQKLQIISRADTLDHCLAQCCSLLGQCHESTDPPRAQLDFIEALSRFDLLLSRTAPSQTLEIQLHRAEALNGLARLRRSGPDSAKVRDQLVASEKELARRYAEGHEQLDVGIVQIETLMELAVHQATASDSTATKEAAQSNPDRERALSVCRSLLQVDPRHPRLDLLLSQCGGGEGPNEVAALPKRDDPTLVSGILEQRHVLRRSLEKLQIEHLQANRVVEAVEVWQQRQQLKRSGRQLRSSVTTAAFNEPEEGLSQLRQIRENQEIDFLEVEGAIDGHVWGAGPYRDDSDLSAAAVHSGHLKPGEVKFVGVRFLPGPSTLEGRTANGVVAAGGESPVGRYEILGAGFRDDQFYTLRDHAEPLSRSEIFLAQGNNINVVFGDGIYSSDSNIGMAAVHAGLLEDGEFGFVRVEMLPGQSRYPASTRHGVTTRESPTAWPHSFRLLPLTVPSE